jgi:hypothetical protein
MIKYLLSLGVYQKEVKTQGLNRNFRTSLSPRRFKGWWKGIMSNLKEALPETQPPRGRKT